MLLGGRVHCAPYTVRLPACSGRQHLHRQLPASCVAVLNGGISQCRLCQHSSPPLYTGTLPLYKLSWQLLPAP